MSGELRYAVDTSFVIAVLKGAVQGDVTVFVALAAASLCCTSALPACNQSSSQNTSTGRQFASDTTGSLLDRWNPQPNFADETEENGRIGLELGYRLTGGEMAESESQRFLDVYYKLDRHGARRQLARTPPVWPLDGHAFVRAVAIYPVITTELRWRRVGEANWRIVAHHGDFAYLDLGPPAEGLQTVGIEYQLMREQKRIWQGRLDVTYEGRGALSDVCTLVREPAAGEWLRGSLVPSLRLYTRRRLGYLEIYPPPIAKNPHSLHMAFKVALIRDGVVVGEACTVFGRGVAPSTCGSRPPPMSIEWLRPDAVFGAGESKWSARLTSVPELAATSEFDDYQASDPPPRKVWVGSIEIPIEVSRILK